MYNDFVLIGPKNDPAQITGGSDIVAAFRIKHCNSEGNTRTGARDQQVTRITGDLS
jgi:ABC-type tungstate transport system permease subunit